MTRVIKNDNFVPVTLLEVPAMKVVGFKTELKDGYDAMIVGILEDIQEVKLSEGKKTLSKKVFTDIAEFTVSQGNTLQIGDDVTLDIFEGITEVEISSISKGK
jgi:large subunit ribosomal protein L3